MRRLCPIEGLQTCLGKDGLTRHYQGRKSHSSVIPAAQVVAPARSCFRDAIGQCGHQEDAQICSHEQAEEGCPAGGGEGHESGADPGA